MEDQFHMKCWALGLGLKKKAKIFQKWPVEEQRSTVKHRLQAGRVQAWSLTPGYFLCLVTCRKLSTNPTAQRQMTPRDIQGGLAPPNLSYRHRCCSTFWKSPPVDPKWFKTSCETFSCWRRVMAKGWGTRSKKGLGWVGRELYFQRGGMVSFGGRLLQLNCTIISGLILARYHFVPVHVVHM